ncbi:DJ-1/PfpI family protein [Rodentibacter abscessus]
MNIYCVLFNGYESLDLVGAVAFLHRLPNASLHYISTDGGEIKSSQGIISSTQKLDSLLPNSLLLVVGGQGTRALVNDTQFIDTLTKWVKQAAFCLCVCTGSALVAKTGLLNHLPATSNKRAFEWVKNVNPKVNWQAIARWVKADKFYTSSGVSAGMDMVLGFIADQFNETLAIQLANQLEYRW